MFGLKMIGLTRAITLCNRSIIHLIPVQTTAILNMFFEPEFDKLKKLFENSILKNSTLMSIAEQKK